MKGTRKNSEVKSTFSTIEFRVMNYGSAYTRNHLHVVDICSGESHAPTSRKSLGWLEKVGLPLSLAWLACLWLVGVVRQLPVLLLPVFLWCCHQPQQVFTCFHFLVGCPRLLFRLPVNTNNSLTLLRLTIPEYV